jgi:DNA-binding MurR/RpiR family transcriptional regulator
VADLARTIHTATPQDLLLAIDVAGQSPNIARSLSEARSRGIHTAAIVAVASLASARSADVVLSAVERPSTSTGMVITNVMIYVLVEALLFVYAERFAGAEQAIAEITDRIREISE